MWLSAVIKYSHYQTINNPYVHFQLFSIIATINLLNLSESKFEVSCFTFI